MRKDHHFFFFFTTIIESPGVTKFQLRSMTQSGVKLQFRDAIATARSGGLADDLRWSAGQTLINCLAEKAPLPAAVRRARLLTWPRQPILTITD